MSNLLKKVSLTDRIKYIHCGGCENCDTGCGECPEDTTFGVMIFLGQGVYPFRTAEIRHQDDFKFWYRNFYQLEISEAFDPNN